MADINREINSSRQPIDLNQLYGIDEITRTPLTNLEDLTGYNLTTSNWSNTKNSKELNNNLPENIQPNLTTQEQVQFNSKSKNVSPMAPLQQQEQSFPTIREPEANFRLNNTSSQNNMQTEKDIKAFLQKQIGQTVKIQFLVGTNALVVQEGTLAGIGDNYIILSNENTGELLICNFDDIKFVQLKNRS